MYRSIVLIAILTMAGNASALELSQMQIKKYDTYTKVTCSYRMPKIEYAAPLYFTFEMRTNAGSSGTDVFEFTVSPEENRYVEFGPNGTKVILRKTTKGVWKIALVRNFESPEGQVTCDGAIRESWRADASTLSDFKRQVGYFDRETYQYETTWEDYTDDVRIECVVGFPGCDGGRAEGTFEYGYSYRHSEPIRVLDFGPDWDECNYMWGNWGCGPAVEAGLLDLTAFQATLRIWRGPEITFTADEVKTFTSREVLAFEDTTDAWTFKDMEMTAIDVETGTVIYVFPGDTEWYEVYIDFSDGSSAYGKLYDNRLSVNDRVP